MGKVKTTVYLDDADYRRLKRLAASRDASAAELIRCAVSDFVDRADMPGLPRWVGSVASGDPTWAGRDEENLEGLGES
jgi:predicted transcriptional regulator